MRIVFQRVARPRPIVLTAHEVGELSKAAGRDVLPELEAIRGERFEAKTLGQLVRALQARLAGAAPR